MQLDNLIIPPCLRGFASDAPSTELHRISIHNGLVGHIEYAQAAIKNVAISTLISCPVDVHTHIDKTYVVDEVGAAEGDLFAAITRMGAHRAGWSAEHIRTRMQRAVQEAYSSGTRALRTHLDWTENRTPTALPVFEDMQREWRGRMALQCVSLTPLDMFDDALAGEAIAQEMARINQAGERSSSERYVSERYAGEAALLGAFVYRNAGLHDKLQRVFDLAQQYNLSLDFHVDEGLDMDARGLHAIAELTIKNAYQGRVTCGHACSLSMQPADDAIATLKLCALAGIHLVALPSTNLYLQGAWNATPVERGITRLKEAVAHGVSASIATDNVADGFYPYGSYDLLDTYALGVQAAHLSPADAWLASITTAPAAAMALPWDGKIAVGCPADLVLLPATTAYELVSPAGRTLHTRRVMRHGQWL